MRSAMPAASQLPGKGPLMWMMPLHLHLNRKSDYDDDKLISSQPKIKSGWEIPALPLQDSQPNKSQIC